jgi:hypothetical protein
MAAVPHPISQVLRVLDLTDRKAESPELSELAQVLSADYRTVRGLPSAELARALVRIAKSGVDPRRKAWKKWRTVEDYRVRLDAAEIAVHASPYTRGAGLMLWGFSCDARRGDDGAFVIFLNTAHQPGAVAATVAHELGHYIHRAIMGSDCATTAPLATDFAGHLHDPTELFADGLAALSAFGVESQRVLGRSGSRDASDEIADALAAIDSEYRIDFADPALTAAWRVRYLTATVHLYKLRRALRETAGI